MYLRSCHIENFGKLHDFAVDFAENPTQITGENEWGKSTLAAFIRVMFYGFEGENKRADALERERVRYRPWQGGVYGGELEFETGGKCYRMNRTFGMKEAEDTFALYDGATGVPCSDYSEKIGEELFRINSESFRRTVFIAQNDCVTATTDSINAKLGNLAETMDDLGRYEQAQARIRDEMNAMSPTRKTGSIRKQKEEIAGIRSELRKREAVETACRDLNHWLANVRQEQEDVLQRRAALREEESRASAYQAAAAKKAHYDSLLRQKDERKASADEALCAMGGHVPDPERLEGAESSAGAMLRLRAEIRANRLDEEERTEWAASQRAGESDEETINGFLEQWKHCEEQAIDLNVKQTVLDDKKDALAEVMSSGRKGNALFLLPAAALIVGILLYQSGYQPLGTGVATAGVTWLAVLLIRCLAARKQKQTECAELSDEISSLEQEIRGDEDRLDRTAGEILDYLERCGCPADGRENAPAKLYELKHKLQRFRALDTRQKRCEQAMTEYRELAAGVQDFLAEHAVLQEQPDCADGDAFAEYGTEAVAADRVNAAVNALRQAVTHYESEAAQLRSCEQAVRQFEQETDVAKLRALGPTPQRSTEEIRAELRQCEEALEQSHRTEDAYLKQLDNAQTEMEQLDEQAELLETLEAECSAALQQYSDLDLTGKYLTRAKELFIAQYTEPITRAYRKYYELLSGCSGEEFRMDANIRMTRREAGEQRDLRSLSTGSRDLTGICLRMALINAMYPDEKPFVILDDSFVNLDDARLASAKRFLREIAKEYQIIYFTCQRSRGLA